MSFLCSLTSTELYHSTSWWGSYFCIELCSSPFLSVSCSRCEYACAADEDKCHHPHQDGLNCLDFHCCVFFIFLLEKGYFNLIMSLHLVVGFLLLKSCLMALAKTSALTFGRACLRSAELEPAPFCSRSIATFRHIISFRLFLFLTQS